MSIVITLIVVGSLLIFAEIFLPGMIAGMFGAVCLLAAILFGYQQFELPTAHYLAFGIFFLAGVEVVAWLLWFPNSRLAQRFISKGAIGSMGTQRPELIGEAGVALTELRPSGAMRLSSGARVDVVTEGELIERGRRVKIIDVEGFRVVVQEDETSAD
jgi:membrane-bound serine protease (ClpP class)